MAGFIVCARAFVKSFLWVFPPVHLPLIARVARILWTGLVTEAFYFVWLAESSGTDKILTFDRRGFLSFRFGKNRRFELLLDL
jgi:hypothetical protein